MAVKIARRLAIIVIILLLQTGNLESPIFNMRTGKIEQRSYPGRRAPIRPINRWVRCCNKYIFQQLNVVEFRSED